MKNIDLKWMKYSINIASDITNNVRLRVGAVLTKNDKLKYCASSDNQDSWLSKILLQTNNKKEHLNNLYLTINTMSIYGSFELNRLLKHLTIDNIYIGLPDPTLIKYKSKDPIVALNNIARYPDDLQKLIIDQNSKSYLISEQNINFIPYYATTRISNLLLTKLGTSGFLVSKKEIETHKNIGVLIKYIVEKFEISVNKATMLINSLLSEAFNEKYSSYNYRDDVRSISKHWIDDFNEICDNILQESFIEKQILNIGVGSGDEAITIFDLCKSITFVDIANQGLNKIKSHMPHARTHCARAEDLSIFLDNTFDLYISLRTYNSSFFEINTALAEAYRVLKNNSKIIISIANGFLYPLKNCILSGLIIPNTEFVDIYRGLSLIKVLSSECYKLGFDEITIIPTNTEIYLTARVKK